VSNLDLYKSNAENFKDALEELRTATTAELLDILRLAGAYHRWFISAAEQVLAERAKA
jgi:hypothetical protein